MVRVYEQVDVAAVDGSIGACVAAFSLASGEYNRELQESGSLGSGTNVITSNTATRENAIHFESEVDEPNSTSWPAGDWVVRINVTTGNTNVHLRNATVCRVDSSGVDQGLVGQLSALDIAATAGVKTETIPGSAQSGAAATDRFYFIWTISRPTGHGSQSATVTNDQLFDTPFAPAAGGPSIAALMATYRRRTRRH